MLRIRGVVANYLASQASDPGIDSHQHQKDSWLIWRHARKDIVFSCNLRCRLIFLHGRSRTYCVSSLRAGPVGRISYNLYRYFDCKHGRYVTCDLINEYTFHAPVPNFSFPHHLHISTGRNLIISTFTSYMPKPSQSTMPRHLSHALNTQKTLQDLNLCKISWLFSFFTYDHGGMLIK